MNNLLKKIKFCSELFLKDFYNLEKISLFLKVFPYTMVGYKRLSNVYSLSEQIIKDGKEGSFAECGVWKGGCVAVMAYLAKKENKNRKTWLLDSFEGLPEPTKEDGNLAEKYSDNKIAGNLAAIDKCVGPIEDVKAILNKLKIAERNTAFEKGWFQDTLPKIKGRIGKIALLRLDGDWYESTKVCLDNLYDNVIIGGYIIIDDYGHWEGSKKAIDEFLKKRNISPKLIKIDYTGIYFIREQ